MVRKLTKPRPAWDGLRRRLFAWADGHARGLREPPKGLMAGYSNSDGLGRRLGIGLISATKRMVKHGTGESCDPLFLTVNFCVIF
jgi:hypothetical protein